MSGQAQTLRNIIPFITLERRGHLYFERFNDYERLLSIGARRRRRDITQAWQVNIYRSWAHIKEDTD
jgi:hypothetical protein